MKILVISAHPDDEILGLGGTLLKHKEKGDDIIWLIITDMKKKDGFTQDQINTRLLEIDKISRILNSQTLSFNFSTAKLSSLNLNDIITRISDVIETYRPHRIYTTNRSDVHSDHRIVFQATISASKHFRHPYVKEVLMYECLSETEFAPPFSENAFLPNYFIDISKYLNKKIEMMKIYESEIHKFPFPRSEQSIKSLAMYRGSTVGFEAAEAFQIIKLIEN